VLVLVLLGADAYIQDPGNRIGYFSGYPITYGGLVAGLLPCALLFASERSRLLTAVTAASASAMLIFSQSRSSWVAVTVMLIVVAIVQARAGNYRALRGIAMVVVVLTALILGTSSLHRIVGEKLSSKIDTSQSVTHREWSYHYALQKIGSSPVFGAEEPGFSAKESFSKTTIGAIDDGYVSIAVDMGLVGLIAALIPVGIALALGIVGMAVVAAFYDSFYWAQLDLLLGAMGGVLSTRIAGITQPAAATKGQSRQGAPELQTGDLTSRRREGALGWAGSWGSS
jgi:O-antigen ligase